MTAEADMIHADVTADHLTDIQSFILRGLLSERTNSSNTRFKFETYVYFDQYRHVPEGLLRAHLAKVGVDIEFIPEHDVLRATFNPEFIRNYEPLMKTVVKSHWFSLKPAVEVPVNEIDRVKLALVNIYPSFTDAQLRKYIRLNGTLTDNGLSQIHVHLYDVHYFALRDFARRHGATITELTFTNVDSIVFNF